MNGFIKQINNQRYRVRWRDPDGTNRSRTFDSQKDAQRFLAHVRSSTAFNQPPLTIKQESPTLKSVTDEWWKSKKHLSHNTRVGYQAVTNRHLQPLLSKRLSNITASDIEAVYAQHAAPTAKKIRIVLSQIYKYALKHELVSVNVVALTDMGRKDTNDHHAPDPSHLPSVNDVERIAERVPDRYRAFVLAAALSGLRLGELCGLEKQYVNLSERRMHVVQQWSAAAKAFTEPKTKASTRVVVFSERLVEPLEAHMAQYSRSSLVFCATNGAPIHPTNFRLRVWQPATTAAGWSELHFHDLRHVYASLLIKSGVNVALVAKLLGHSSPQVTMSVYSGFFEDDFDAAHAALDNL